MAKLDKIWEKQNIQPVKGADGKYKKTNDSIEFKILDRTYYFNSSPFVESNFDDTIEKLLYKDENNFDDNIYSAISNLRIEGIFSSKISSSKAEKYSRNYFESNFKNKDNFLDENLINFLNFHKKNMKKDSDLAFSSIASNKRPARKIFNKDYGLRTANLFLNYQSSINEKNLFITYQFLTFFGKNLDDEDQLENGSFYRKGDVAIMKNLNKVDQGIRPDLVEDNLKYLISLLNFKDFFNFSKMISKDKNEDEAINIWVLAFIWKFLFIEIHPYYDGNGRMSRILLLWILKKFSQDIDIFWISYINNVIDFTINSYSNAIKATRESSDLTYFVSYMNYVCIISAETKKFLTYLHQKTKFNKKNNIFKSLIVCYLLINNNDFMSWKIIQKNIPTASDYSERRIKDILDEMVEDNVLFKDKELNSNIYKLNRDLFN